MPIYTNPVGTDTGALNVTPTSGGSWNPMDRIASTGSSLTPEFVREYQRWLYEHNTAERKRNQEAFARLESKRRFVNRFGTYAPLRWYADWERDYPDGRPAVPERVLHPIDGEGDFMPTTEDNNRTVVQQRYDAAVACRETCHQAVKFIILQNRRKDTDALITFLTDTKRLPANSWADVRKAYGPWADGFLSKARSNSETGSDFFSRFLDASDKHVEDARRELQSL